jgi:hypothetical protein
MSGATHSGREPRRHRLRRQERLNGIDYVEIGEDRRTLKVVLFRSPPEGLRPENFTVTGGVRIHPRVTEIRLIEPADPDLERAVRLVFDRPGDSSTYRLQIGVGGFDPRYARIDFTFGDSVDYRLDCAPAPEALPTLPRSPELDYLAKDYAGFRRLAFDRLAQIIPSWGERHVPDVGVMLVEMMAYVGDQLSYYQDAVATEAYLQTARLRTSVRRHVRLIDYAMHEGCDARVWLHLRTEQDITLEGSKLRFAVDDENGEVEEFAPIDSAAVQLSEALNEIAFYAWGDGDCCLPRGATSATLADKWIGTGEHRARRLQALAAGQALLIEAVPANPRSGERPDPRHRHVVRLTRVQATSQDPLYDRPVVEIEWAAEDALPFTVALPPPPDEGESPAIIAVARGNMVLADHGRWVREKIPTRDRPPPPVPAFAAQPRRPRLRQTGITFREPVDPMAPASRAVQQDPTRAVAQVLIPDLHLRLSQPEQPSDPIWTVRSDLIDSGAEDRHFVVDIEDDGAATLRFGDGVRGVLPGEGEITVAYRVGNGPAGNVGAEAITRVLSDNPADVDGVCVRNPLPATGGTAPEPTAEVKLLAPHVFRERRERAITAEDYARAAERVFGVRRAAADIGQLGFIRLARVAIQTTDGADPSDRLLLQVRNYLQARRRIGHDIEVRGAQMVALDVAIAVHMRDNYLRAHVLASLREVLSSGLGRNGRPGLFHPIRMSFGTPVHGSQIVAAAQSVTGVEWVRLTRLQRLAEDPAREDRAQLATAALSLLLNRFEIARMDNDAAHPERGCLTITLSGGR